MVDELAIYARALSATEILNHYNLAKRVGPLATDVPATLDLGDLVTVHLTDETLTRRVAAIIQDFDRPNFLGLTLGEPATSPDEVTDRTQKDVDSALSFIDASTG
jgi:hypothetical protein